jgi:hypothetical protein
MSGALHCALLHTDQSVIYHVNVNVVKHPLN